MKRLGLVVCILLSSILITGVFTPADDDDEHIDIIYNGSEVICARNIAVENMF